MTQAAPLPPEITAGLAALSPTQLAWLSGYCWAQSQQSAAPALPEAAAPARRIKMEVDVAQAVTVLPVRQGHRVGVEDRGQRTAQETPGQHRGAEQHRGGDETHGRRMGEFGGLHPRFGG